MVSHHIEIPQWARDRGRQIRTSGQLDPKRTAVLAIDLQNFFVGDGQAIANPYASSVIPVVNRLTGALREAGATVIFTQHAFDEEKHDRPRRRPLSAASQANIALRADLLPGTRGFALHDDVEVDPCDVILTKLRMSAFHPYANCGLLPVLEERGITTIIICGLVTNGCCETTARDAFQYDFSVIFAADATATLSDAEHNATLLNLALFFADVQVTADLLHAAEPIFPA